MFEKKENSMISGDNKTFRLNKYQKKYIKFLIILLIGTFLLSVIMIAISYINTDHKYYNSLEEIAKSYYSEENVVYIRDGRYSYIILNRKKDNEEKLIYETDNGKFLVFNNISNETKNSNKSLILADVDSKSFYSFIHVYEHESKYIILIERYFINNEKLESQVYDDYGIWQQVNTIGREYYFNVFDYTLFDENYELSVKINGETYFLFNKDKYEKEK